MLRSNEDFLKLNKALKIYIALKPESIFNGGLTPKEKYKFRQAHKTIFHFKVLHSIRKRRKQT